MGVNGVKICSPEEWIIVAYQKKKKKKNEQPSYVYAVVHVIAKCVEIKCWVSGWEKQLTFVQITLFYKFIFFSLSKKFQTHLHFY